MSAKNVLLTYDIGNTNIDLGLFSGGELLWRSKVSVSKAPQTKKILSKVISEHGKPDAAIACSVVPNVFKILGKIRSKMFPQNLFGQPVGEGEDRYQARMA